MAYKLRIWIKSWEYKLKSCSRITNLKSLSLLCLALCSSILNTHVPKVNSTERSAFEDRAGDLSICILDAWAGQYKFGTRQQFFSALQDKSGKGTDIMIFQKCPFIIWDYNNRILKTCPFYIRQYHGELFWVSFPHFIFWAVLQVLQVPS